MKKVKLMLAGIAVLAIIGGGMAFKAKKVFGSCIYTTTVGAPPSVWCDIPNPNVTFTTIPIGLRVKYTIKCEPSPCLSKAYTTPKK